LAEVQNRIIENYPTLREELQAEAVMFRENGSNQNPAEHPSNRDVVGIHAQATDSVDSPQWYFFG